MTANQLPQCRPRPDARHLGFRGGSRLASGFLLACLLVVGAPAIAAGGDPGERRTEHFVVYFGIMPAGLAQSRLSAHPSDPGPHGATPLLADTHHLVVAVFDTHSGARVTDAAVQAHHVPPHGVAIDKPLLPMALGDTLSYGNAFFIPDGANHRFVVRIRRGERVARVEFTYDNLHGSAR